MIRQGRCCFALCILLSITEFARAQDNIPQGAAVIPLPPGTYFPDGTGYPATNRSAPTLVRLPRVCNGTVEPYANSSVFQAANSILNFQVPFLYQPTRSVKLRNGEQLRYRLDGLARAFYSNDQRIEWSGQEATFGVEGAVAGAVGTNAGCWDVNLVGELYLSQPYGRNILVDNVERQSYRGNFEADTVDMSRLYMTMCRNDFMIAFGKMITPFGRMYSPSYLNDRADTPFIRSEAILWRETGLLLQYSPGIFVGTVGLVNGSENRDTNSSKGLVSRIAIETDLFAIGASVKYQDGIGSENQKTFNNHIGIDAMCRHGRFTLSAEAIYDEYGFRRPGFDPNDITWGRSIYNRDQNIGLFVPITGVGYYLNLDMVLNYWTIGLNYGEYYPKQIGDPLHDPTNRRGILHAAYRFSSSFESYSAILVENNVPNAQGGRTRQGTQILFGFQYSL